MSKKFVENILGNWIDELNDTEKLRAGHISMENKLKIWKRAFSEAFKEEFKIEFQDLSYKECQRLVDSGIDKDEALYIADYNVFDTAKDIAIKSACNIADSVIS